MSSNENPSPPVDLNPNTIAKSPVNSPFPIAIPRPPMTPPPPPPTEPNSEPFPPPALDPIKFELPGIFNYNFENGDLRDRWNDKEENLSDYFNYGMNEDIFRLYRKKLRHMTDIMSKLYSEHKSADCSNRGELGDKLTVHGNSSEDPNIIVRRPMGSDQLDTTLGVEFGGLGPMLFSELIKDELLVQLNLNPEKFWLKHINMEPADLFKAVIIQAHMEGGSQGFKYFSEHSMTGQLAQQEEKLLAYFKKHYKGDRGYLDKLWQVGKIRRDDLRLYKGKQYMGVDSHYSHRTRDWERIKFSGEGRRRNDEKWISKRQDRQRNVNMYQKYGEVRRRGSRSNSQREEKRRNGSHAKEKKEKRTRGRNRKEEREKKERELEDRKRRGREEGGKSEERRKARKRRKKAKKEKKKKKKEENGKRDAQANHKNREENEKRKRKGINRILLENKKEFGREHKSEKRSEERRTNGTGKRGEKPETRRKTRRYFENEHEEMYPEGFEMLSKRNNQEFARRGRQSYERKFEREREKDWEWERKRENGRNRGNRFWGNGRRY